MPLSIEMPDDVQVALEGEWGDLARHLKECLAVDGYRQRLLSLAQVRRLMGLATRWEAQEFLGRHQVEVFAFDPAELDREGRLQEAVAASLSAERVPPAGNDCSLGYHASAPFDRDRGSRPLAEAVRLRDCTGDRHERVTSGSNSGHGQTMAGSSARLAGRPCISDTVLNRTRGETRCGGIGSDRTCEGTPGGLASYG